MRKLVLGIVFLCMMMLSSSVAFAGAQDFTLVNNTGVLIHKLFVSPTNTNDWQEDVLGVSQLSSGDSVEITFSGGERATYWDLKVEDTDGNGLYWQHINLKQISTITLNSDGTATYQ